MIGIPKRIVVIGGVAAGPSAAAKARRTDENAEITVLEKGEYISYSGCGLPYYISKVVASRDELLVMTPESFSARHNVNVLTRHEAQQIQTEDKTVRVKDLDNNLIREFPYDALIIASGAVPRAHPAAAIDLRNIFYLRTVPDADAIMETLYRDKPKAALIVGGGLIGLEMAESLTANGLEVTVVEKVNQILSPFDDEMAFAVERHLRDKGVNVIKGVGIEEFIGSPNQGVKEAVLETGIKVPADLVLVSIGVRPQVSLAEEAGVELGPTGAIVVNKFMETNVPGVYAAGDCAESLNIITGSPTWTPLGSVANRQGRTAGTNAAGGKAEFAGVLGSGVAKVFDLTAARSGLTEREALERGYSVQVVHVHPLNRAHIYPEAEMLHIKLVVDKESQVILGGQIIGREGVDKRMDVITSAIQSGLKAGELFDLDYAYSPPYAPAKDPAAVAGAVAHNALNSGVRFITPSQMKELLDRGKGTQIVDVREPRELKEHGYLRGAVNIPLDSFRDRLHELDKMREVVLYCRQGLRGYLAGKILVNNGYKRVANLSGGLLSWPYENMIMK